MEKITRSVGVLAMTLGTIAALSTAAFMVVHIAILIILGVFCGLMGFMSSSAYVWLNLRYQVNQNKVTPGLIGLFLSTLPVVYILILNAMHHK